MAKQMNSPSTGTTWELSVDDLLAPLPEAPPRLGGPGPFVINLGASSTPKSTQSVNIAGCEHAHVYEIQRTEDRRVRFRLRIGPFASEEEVNAILEKVRTAYPSAMTATADPDDLRVIAALQAKAQAQKHPLRRPQQQPREIAAVATAAPPPSAAVRVSAQAQAPELAAGPAAAPARVVPAAKTTAASRAADPHAKRAPSAEAAHADHVLTQLELCEDAGMGWFVIQLIVTEHAVDVEKVPKHDIFKAYRLYSVAGLDQGRVMHALRLGFFKEEGAARAVASYLAAFYESPSVKRVSAAERDRFADRRVDPRRDAGAGAAPVIEITNDRYVRQKAR